MVSQPHPACEVQQIGWSVKRPLSLHDASFKGQDVHILDKEDGWFERSLKEAIYVKVERPSLDGQGWGLRHHLPSSYNAVLKTFKR